MKKYIQHIRAERTPHERRRIAMQIAGVCTAFLFVVWISTLGLRFGTPGDPGPSTAATLYAVQEASTTLGY